MNIGVLSDAYCLMMLNIDVFSSRSETMYSAFCFQKYASKFFFAILRASDEISINSTFSAKSAILVPIIPDPVHTSMTSDHGYCLKKCRVLRTRHSVSSRGISTSGVTKKSRLKKVTLPSLYS